MTDESIQAAADAFEAMSDDEASAWLAAGDYTAVNGIALPERAVQVFTDLASGEEVAGFALDPGSLGFGLELGGPQLSFVHNVDKASPSLFQHCCTGQHLKEAVITVR